MDKLLLQLFFATVISIKISINHMDFYIKRNIIFILKQVKDKFLQSDHNPGPGSDRDPVLSWRSGPYQHQNYNTNFYYFVQ